MREFHPLHNLLAAILCCVKIIVLCDSKVHVRILPISQCEHRDHLVTSCVPSHANEQGLAVEWDWGSYPKTRRTALWLAAYCCNEEVAELLLSCGAKADQTFVWVSTT